MKEHLLKIYISFSGYFFSVFRGIADDVEKNLIKQKSELFSLQKKRIAREKKSYDKRKEIMREIIDSPDFYRMYGESSDRHKKKLIIAFKNSVKEKLLETDGHVCKKCHKRDVPLTIDHIIPVYFLSSLGVNANIELDEDNIQLLCKQCNTLKANKLDLGNPKTKPLLDKYLNNAFPTEKKSLSLEKIKDIPKHFIEKIRNIRHY